MKFGEGWLRTGDVGSLTPEDILRLTDRAKDVIESGGEWMELEPPHGPPSRDRGERDGPDPRWQQVPGSHSHHGRRAQPSGSE